MALNVELAKRVLEQVEEHPETHSQAFFQSPLCGTQHCIAGWAIALGEPDYDWNTNYLQAEGEFEDNPNNPEAVALSLLVTGPKSVRNARLEHRLRRLFYHISSNAEAVHELKNLIEENS